MSNSVIGEDEKNRPEKQETISELADRHLNDENHTTTDEEMRNATIELSDAAPPDDEKFKADNTPVIPPMPGEPQIKEEKKDDNFKPPNPYDVLGS